MSDRDIPYNSDQLPPFVGTKPGEIHCYFPKEEQRARAAGIVPGEKYEDELTAMLNMELKPGPLELLTMDQARTAILEPSKEGAVHRVWNMCEEAFRAKITSGELMVMKTVKGLMTNGDAWRRCSGCNIEYSPSSRWNFCPGCGAKIIA